LQEERAGRALAALRAMSSPVARKVRDGEWTAIAASELVSRLIRNAVREGRGIFDNIQKFIHYLLSCNAGEVMLMFMAVMLGMPLPLIIALSLLPATVIELTKIWKGYTTCET
jgi:magnesium-transporting ATPase (P-type)